MCMLVLSRKKGESIIIDDDIKLKIIDIDGEHVKLGIDAPKNIIVHRQEVYEAIQQENEQATHVGMNLDEIKNFKKK